MVRSSSSFRKIEIAEEVPWQRDVIERWVEGRWSDHVDVERSMTMTLQMTFQTFDL
jgi:hypothetical protein